MNTRKLRQLLAATALSAAAVAGTTAPASAAPNSNLLAPIAAAAASASSGSIGASEGLTVDALIAARMAGFPIYEAGQTVIVSASKMGTTYATEYRRVQASNDMSSPTTKFVTFGAVAPDQFYTVPGSGGDSIVVNMRPVENPIFQRLTYDMTPQKWLNSPLVQTPGGGPSAGIVLVR